jgi:hypothetical protein
LQQRCACNRALQGFDDTAAVVLLPKITAGHAHYRSGGHPESQHWPSAGPHVRAARGGGLPRRGRAPHASPGWVGRRRAEQSGCSREHRYYAHVSMLCHRDTGTAVPLDKTSVVTWRAADMTRNYLRFVKYTDN